MRYVQGCLTDESTTVGADSRPIRAGIVAAAAPGPLWGGLPVSVFVPRTSLGSALQLAQNVSQITGFTVFDKSTALISSNKDPVPSAGPSMGINYVLVGSGVELVLQADPAVLKLLRGATTPTPVSWDFENQRVIAFSGAALPVKYVVALLNDAMVIVCEGGVARWEYGAPAVVVHI